MTDTRLTNGKSQLWHNVCRALANTARFYNAEAGPRLANVFDVTDAVMAEVERDQMGNRMTSKWIRIEHFSGTPNTALLAWWWSEASKDMELDELLLDEKGKVCGKGGCGADYFSHVMLAEFDRPTPPGHPNEVSDAG